MRHGHALGFAIALGCLLSGAPPVRADEPTSSLPVQRVLTDRNGVVLDGSTAPALAWLRLSKAEGEVAPLQLALDIKATGILQQELTDGLERFSAKGAAGFIMDVNTGEIVALASVDGDHSQPRATVAGDARPNRITQGVYEIGSSAKLMTIAMALDAGKASMASRIDGSVLHYGRFRIHDYADQKWSTQTLPDAMTHGSNIAAARLAQRVGTLEQKAFLEKMGQLDSLDIAGIDRVAPILPEKWTGLQTVVTSFGHGIAVSPLQAGMAIAAMANGGTLRQPTIFKRNAQATDDTGQRVISSDTSAKMRYLLRLNAEQGTAMKANVAGYFVGGATSTAEKVVNGRYDRRRVITTFTAVYPADKPQYLLMTMLDEPQALRETFGFITAGWNAAPVAAKVIERTAPVLGVEYRATLPATPFPGVKTVAELEAR
jgi:cell division protein FtsI (penicillin-binding protein 3)